MNQIKELRLSKGLSQRELVKHLSVTQSQVAKWENGVNQPTLPALIELANFFDCSIDYIAGREKEDGTVLITKDLTKEEEQLLSFYRQLNQNDKEAILRFAKLAISG